MSEDLVRSSNGVKSISPGRKESSDRTARHSIPNQISQIWRELSKSNKLALMLYQASHYKLADLQLEYIANFQRTMNLAQIQKALKFLHTLTTDPRTRARLYAKDYLVPYYRSRPTRLKERRRIGVGYRDKGSLPMNSKPSWEKENERSVSLPNLIPRTVLMGLPSIPSLNENPEEEEPAEVVSGKERPSRSKFQSYYLPLLWSLELETLSVSEEIEGFTVPHGTESPSL